MFQTIVFWLRNHQKWCDLPLFLFMVVNFSTFFQAFFIKSKKFKSSFETSQKFAHINKISSSELLATLVLLFPFLPVPTVAIYVHCSASCSSFSRSSPQFLSSSTVKWGVGNKVDVVEKWKCSKCWMDFVNLKSNIFILVFMVSFS